MRSRKAHALCGIAFLSLRRPAEALDLGRWLWRDEKILRFENRIPDSSSPLDLLSRGLSPAKAKEYEALSKDGVFSCDGGATRLNLNYINDEFCDCKDGSDEPGTAACSMKKQAIFYCVNSGYKPVLLPTSRVDDGVCDCCDGSDEQFSGGVLCENTCDIVASTARSARAAGQQVLLQGLSVRETYIAQGKAARIAAEEYEITTAAAYQTSVDTLASAKAAFQLAETIAKARTQTLESQSVQSPVQGEDTAPAVAVDATEEVNLHTDVAVENEEAVNEQAIGSEEVLEPSEEELQQSQQDVESEYKHHDVYHDDDYLAYGAEESLIDMDAVEHADEGVDSEVIVEEDNVPEVKATGPVKPPARPAEDPAVVVARSAVAEAERQWRALQRQSQDSKKEVATDYGEDWILWPLKGKCLKREEGAYIYEVCPYKEAFQIESTNQSKRTSIGKWGGIKRVDDSGNPENLKFTFTNGARCHGAGPRTLSLDVVCGTDDQVMSITETEMCRYTGVFASPVGCLPEEVEGFSSAEIREEL